ncbi:MAG: DUF427 domain-containing protein [Phototrophicaceae bacterium]|jgi:uncharacterized protein (DUF427 family)
MPKVTYKGIVLAESANTEVVEGNYYFPPESLNREYFQESAAQLHTTCPWKGIASYYDVVVNGETLKDVAWYYPIPKTAAENITRHVAFYKNRVTIEG